MKKTFVITAILVFISCESQKTSAENFEIIKTEEQWKQELTPEQFRILRLKGTERAFTGIYWDHFEEGTYVCAACKTPLFESSTKFDSHCGWPSFDQAIKGTVKYETDLSFGMIRTEVMCATCGGHLGHVFDDGPPNTTGKRYCTNSASIEFIPKTK